MAIRIDEALWPEDREVVVRLLREYVDALEIDIGFQDIAGELTGLPGRYARPHGVVLIARTGRDVAGISAYRPLCHDLCEMKRLYVRPRFRSGGLGRRLCEALIGDARSHGYRRMVLDTLPSMRSALALYRSLGFQAAPAYYDNPLPAVAYLALDLGREATPPGQP